MPATAVKTIYVKNRQEWRKWLSSNHDKKKEIWIVHYKKHAKKLTIPYDDALNEAICFGWIDGKVRRIDEDRYMQRFTPRRSKSQWSISNVNRYKALLKAGLVTEAGKKVFSEKFRVYKPVLGKNSYHWHLEHKMPKNSSLKQRIEWHRGHQEHCSCRPIPKMLETYFKK